MCVWDETLSSNLNLGYWQVGNLSLHFMDLLAFHPGFASVFLNMTKEIIYAKKDKTDTFAFIIIGSQLNHNLHSFFLNLKENKDSTLV